MVCDVPESGLTKLPDILHQPDGDIVCGCLEAAFGVDSDDRLRVGGPQVHPVCIKFYFQPVFGIDGLFFIFLLNLVKKSVLRLRPYPVLFYFLR